MNLSEFSFVNQQLAGMLKSGLPLEGAIFLFGGFHDLNITQDLSR